MAKEKNNWQEIKTIIFSAIILGLVFGFDDKSETFNLSYWIGNFLVQTILCIIFLLIFILVTKKYAQKQNFLVSFSTWKLQRFGFAHSWFFKGKGIPIGIIAPLFLTIASYGKMFFSAILMPTYSYKKEKRIGKKFQAPTELELSMASLIGPMTLTIIAIFLTALKSIPINNLSIIPFSIAFSTMLPLSRLNGTFVYFGAPAKYVFAMVFIITTYALTKFTTVIQSVIVGIISALIIMALFYIFNYIIKE